MSIQRRNRLEPHRSALLGFLLEDVIQPIQQDTMIWSSSHTPACAAQRRRPWPAALKATNRRFAFNYHARADQRNGAVITG
jgi:hypothetical protein